MKRTTDSTLPGEQGVDPKADRRRVTEGLTLVPTKIFFTKGVGSHRDELRSFELALKDAGIERLNLVHVSSIFPPQCKIISREEGSKLIAPGSIAFCVMARQGSNEMRRLIAASMLASTLGVEFDENANWDEKEQVFKISGEIVRTFNVTQSAVISNRGWTTVVAAGVFIF